MSPDTPVYPLGECLAYLEKNAWQFKHLRADDRVHVGAQMLRSIYYHIGKAALGQSFDTREVFGEQPRLTEQP